MVLGWPYWHVQNCGIVHWNCICWLLSNWDRIFSYKLQIHLFVGCKPSFSTQFGRPVTSTYSNIMHGTSVSSMPVASHLSNNIMVPEDKSSSFAWELGVYLPATCVAGNSSYESVTSSHLWHDKPPYNHENDWYAGLELHFFWRFSCFCHVSF